MPPQLRIDRPSVRSGNVVLEYSHHLNALPVSPMGYGVAWQSLADLRDDLQAFREYLRQPERMVLLALMGRLAADPTFNAATRTALTGRIITLDADSLTAPLVVT